jgi:hypothetical protein
MKVPIIRAADNEVLHGQRSPRSEQAQTENRSPGLAPDPRAQLCEPAVRGWRAVSHVVEPRLDITNAPANTIRNPTIAQKSASTRSAAR